MIVALKVAYVVALIVFLIYVACSGRGPDAPA